MAYPTTTIQNWSHSNVCNMSATMHLRSIISPTSLPKGIDVTFWWSLTSNGISPLIQSVPCLGYFFFSFYQNDNYLNSIPKQIKCPKEFRNFQTHIDIKMNTSYIIIKVYGLLILTFSCEWTTDRGMSVQLEKPTALFLKLSLIKQLV